MIKYKYLLFLFLLCGGHAYAQSNSLGNTPDSPNPDELPIDPVTGTVSYSETVTLQEVSRATLDQRSQHWFLARIKPTPDEQQRYLASAQKCGILTYKGWQEDSIVVQGKTERYKLHYIVQLHTGPDYYHYDINALVIEHFSGSASSKPRLVPLETYVGRTYFPGSLEEKMVQQYKLHTYVFAQHLKESINAAMLKP